MPTIYERAGDEIAELAAPIIEEHHKELVEAKVNIDWIWAVDPDDGPAPLKLHGYPCQAVARVVPAKLRALGHPDAEITIDKANWAQLPDNVRLALLDHELHHLQVSRDKYGNVRTDDYARPKLKMRKHDVQLGWFAAIAERHVEASIEVRQARELVRDFGETFQLELWAELPPTPSKATRKAAKKLLDLAPGALSIPDTDVP